MVTIVIAVLFGLFKTDEI